MADAAAPADADFASEIFAIEIAHLFDPGGPCHDSQSPALLIGDNPSEHGVLKEHGGKDVGARLLKKNDVPLLRDILQ